MNCGARRAALRPYSPDLDPKSPVFMRVFGLPSLSKPIGKPTKSRNFWCNLTQPECCIHNAAQFLGFIILDFRIDVHSRFAVLMACQILHRLRINTSVNQIGDVGVPQHVRGHLEVHRIQQLGIVRLMLTKPWLYSMLPRSTKYSTIISNLLEWERVNPALPSVSCIWTSGNSNIQKL